MRESGHGGPYMGNPRWYAESFDEFHALTFDPLSGGRGCLRSNSRDAAALASLQSEPGPDGYGPVRQPLRRLLSLLLRRLVEEESYSIRPIRLERLQQAGRRQPAVPVGHSGGGHQGGPGALASGARDRRLLRRVHG